MISNFKKFLKLDDNQKLILLKALDYDVDEEGFVIDSNKKNVICKYTNQPVHFNTASILPGSTIIINTSLLTLSEYVTEYLESDEE